MNKTEFHQVQLIPCNKVVYQDKYKRFESMADADKFNRDIEGFAMNIKATGEALGNQYMGLLNPITVVKNGNTFEIRAGNRRFKACSEILKWTKIPAIVFPVDIPIVVLTENLQRENLTNIEIGDWLNRMVEAYPAEMKKEEIISEICNRLGKKPRTIYEYMNTAKNISAEQMAKVRSGETTATAAAQSVRKSGTRKQNPGQSVKRTVSAFNTVSAKLIDKVQEMCANPDEYKKNAALKSQFKRLMKTLEKANEFLS